MTDKAKREKNEKKFGNWEEFSDGGRRYFYEVKGKFGWTARYIKEVDKDENTLKFYQEIYDNQNRLIEVHIKFPVDMGHEKLR